MSITSRFCQSSPLLVVTDLDGTLLDHHDYDFAVTLPILARLKKASVPLVINTSKTRSEWLAMRASFSNEDAFVIENGSAVIFPDGQKEIFGAPKDDLFNTLAELRPLYHFRGFEELGLSGVIQHTGLSSEEAQRAFTREFSEPLLWEDSKENETRFCKEICARGYQTLRGGRFLHVLGRTDKGRALPLLRNFYQAETVVALGDSPNDLAMIEQADIGVLISSPAHDGLEAPKANRLIRSELQGPQGWAATMSTLLDELSI